MNVYGTTTKKKEVHVSVNASLFHCIGVYTKLIDQRVPSTVKAQISCWDAYQIFWVKRRAHIWRWDGRGGGAYLKGLSFSFFKFWPQNNIVLLPVHVKQTVSVNKTVTIRRKPNLCVITFSWVQFSLMSPILSSHSELLDCVFSDFSFLGEG